MDNIVGKNIPSRLLTKWVAELGRLHAQLEKLGVRLTSGEKRRRGRMRLGGEQIAELVADVADDAKVGLTTSTAELRSDMALLAQLKPLIMEARSLERQIDDTRVQAEHEAWTAALDYYAALQRLAAHDPGVKEQLGPVTEYFARRPRRSRVETQAPPPPPSPPPLERGGGPI